MIWFIDSADQTPAPTASRAAIVSVVIGELYEAMWTQLCAASWVAYAERIGVDLIVFKERIDRSDVNRSPAWQKLLVLGLPWMQRYERVIWLDSDIIINREAPNILDYAGPREKIGLSPEGARLSPAEQQVYLERLYQQTTPPDSLDFLWRNTQHNAYVAEDLPPHFELFNTGVMVLSPQHHSDLLLSVYDRPQRTRIYEQAHLSHAILERGVGHVISPRFNWGIMETVRLYLQDEALAGEDPKVIARIVAVLVRAELRNAYFLHFYGAMNLLKMFMRQPEQAAA